VTAAESTTIGVRRWRFIALAVIVIAALVGSFLFVEKARNRQEAAAAAVPAGTVTADLPTVTAEPHIIFRSTTPGTGFGRVAAVPISAPGGPRALTPATCDRVYATTHDAICLNSRPAMVTSYEATLLGPDWKAVRQLPLSGVPSRARLSHDGSLSATTTFVYGHSYTSPGQFSTETLISKTNGSHTDNIESFALFVDGKRFSPKNRNFWGVTFAADDDHFFATAASGQKTWLVRGSISAKTLTALREDAECPSISPDGTKVAFKTRNGLPVGQWRLAVYDLKTGKATLLSETRSVDDQVEWLTDNQVMYGLPRQGEGVSSTDVWVAPADGTGTPKLLIPDAWSPAVIR
jgi:dipeptidyl aminopeptidase/acylaminoacyl peptidase